MNKRQRKKRFIKILKTEQGKAIQKKIEQLVLEDFDRQFERQFERKLATCSHFFPEAINVTEEDMEKGGIAYPIGGVSTGKA